MSNPVAGSSARREPLSNETDPNIRWLRGRLDHFRSLSLDRCELFSVTESERLECAKRKADEGGLETVFGNRSHYFSLIFNRPWLGGGRPSLGARPATLRGAQSV